MVAPTTPRDALVRKRLREFFNRSPDSPINVSYLLSDTSSSGKIHQYISEAANGLDVRLGGGVATIQQYLRASLVDEMHLAVAPTILGSGEHLFAGLDAVALGYRCAKHVPTANTTHIVFTRQGAAS
jgi:dihydrofolate reductase